MKSATLISLIFLSCASLNLFAQNKSATFFDKIDGEFIGGLNNADPNSYPIFNNKRKSNTKPVTTEKDFLDVLAYANRGDIIYLPGDKVFNFSGHKMIKIPGGVTIYSDRGVNRSGGALIYSDSLATNPLFITDGDDIKLVGIRFRGPDGDIINSRLNSLTKDLNEKERQAKLSDGRFLSYGTPNSNFLSIVNKNTQIENCEIYNWSYAGILVNAGATAIIKYSYIHNNQRSGLGYGVCLDAGYADIKGNLFDYNRHAIAGTGRPGTGYTASYNIALVNSSSHVFDMHGGVDRGDNTNIAGDSLKIFNNIIYSKRETVILVRGVPLYPSKIDNNLIVLVGRSNAKSTVIKKIKELFNIKEKETVSHALIRQTGGVRKNIEQSGNITVSTN